MIIDSRNEFCDATALDTSGTGTAAIGDVIDLGSPRNMGQGRALYLTVVVETTVDSAGDGASVEFVAATDDSSSIATNGSASEHASTGVIAEADLVAGARFVIPLGTGDVAYERYMGLLQKTTGEAVTAGKVDAFLTLDPTGWKAYPDALDAIT
jgi:hypothetical protein